MWVPDIGFITQLQVSRLFCCYALAKSVNKLRTSTVLANIGKDGKVHKISGIGKGELIMKSRAHDDAMAELYRKDPEFARQVINSILEDENGDQGELLIVLRQMAKAFGGVPAVAEQAKLNPTQLYRTLSPNGNPALSSLSAILRAMGMRLSVQPTRNQS